MRRKTNFRIYNHKMTHSTWSSTNKAGLFKDLGSWQVFIFCCFMWKYLKQQFSRYLLETIHFDALICWYVYGNMRLQQSLLKQLLFSWPKDSTLFSSICYFSFCFVTCLLFFPMFYFLMAEEKVYVTAANGSQ